MAFIQMRHDDALPFWYRSIDAHKLAIFPPRFDLVEGKLILSYPVSLQIEKSRLITVHVQGRDPEG